MPFVYYITCSADQASFEVNEDVLRALRLRRIVKESHGQALSGVAVNEAYPNLIATTGDVQSSVYDNEHFGDHLDLVSHYVHTSALTSCAWLGAADDALWAIGGADGAIQITSLALVRPPLKHYVFNNTARGYLVVRHQGDRPGAQGPRPRRPMARVARGLRLLVRQGRRRGPPDLVRNPGLFI